MESFNYKKVQSAVIGQYQWSDEASPSHFHNKTAPPL